MLVSAPNPTRYNRIGRARIIDGTRQQKPISLWQRVRLAVGGFCRLLLALWFGAGVAFLSLFLVAILTGQVQWVHGGGVVEAVLMSILVVAFIAGFGAATYGLVCAAFFRFLAAARGSSQARPPTENGGRGETAWRNPYEPPRTETSWPRPWRFISAADFAKIILESLQEVHRPEHEHRLVDGEAFRHLSRRFYRRTQRELETLGFTLLGDLEDVTLNATSMKPRTFIRTMVDRRGTTVAAFYHAKFRPFLRLVGYFLGFPTKCVDLESYTTGGCTYCTTTAPERTQGLHPEEIRKDCVRGRPSLADLYDWHLRTLTTYRVSDQLVRIQGIEDVIRMQNLQHRRICEYLEEVGWATPDYLRNQGVPARMVDEVYGEIQRLLAVQRMNKELAGAGGDAEEDDAGSFGPAQPPDPPPTSPFG